MQSFYKRAVVNLDKLKLGMSPQLNSGDVWVEPVTSEKNFPSYPSRNSSAHHFTSDMTFRASIQIHVTKGEDSC